MTAPTALTDPPIPLACVPDGIPAAERAGHFALLARLFTGALREKRDVPTGCSYRFDAEVFPDLSRWVANERRCCPFLAFTFELAPHGGPIWMRLTGPDGTREFLDVELPGLTTSS